MSWLGLVILFGSAFIGTFFGICAGVIADRWKYYEHYKIMKRTFPNGESYFLIQFKGLLGYDDPEWRFDTTNFKNQFKTYGEAESFLRRYITCIGADHMDEEATPKGQRTILKEK